MSKKTLNAIKRNAGALFVIAVFAASSFLPQISFANDSDMIRVKNPEENEVIRSPYVVKGEARGFWFYEGTFPVKVYDMHGRLIGSSNAQAKGDWQTNSFVPFEAEVDFEIPSSDLGDLILEKGGTSAILGNLKTVVIPVYFYKPIKEGGISFWGRIGSVFTTLAGAIGTGFNRVGSATVAASRGFWDGIRGI
ncbi:MAG: Gmad2 immunoglobulin-like domain-containing protein [Candidatus Pacebacteria bacterium]|nr:Gmad2 immunoglobulin-like domain-containing protein [Candidatus Paceibacterota bacterium]